MTDTAKLCMNGRRQAIQLPRQYRFECTEVYIRKEPKKTDDVIILEKTANWDGFFKLLAETDVPNDFLTNRDDSAPDVKKHCNEQQSSHARYLGVRYP